MTKTNLASRGHLLRGTPVDRKSSFSIQPVVYDMTSFGIRQKKCSCINCRLEEALAQASDYAVGQFYRQTQLPMGQEPVPTH